MLTSEEGVAIGVAGGVTLLVAVGVYFFQGEKPIIKKETSVDIDPIPQHV